MDAFLKDYLEILQSLHGDLQDQLSALPDKALDWSPRVEMNSIAILITHLIGAERYWIGDVAAGDVAGRVRDQEFEAAGLTTAQLKEKLSAATAFVETTFAKLSVADFGRKRHLPRYDRSFTVGWSLLHALEHTAQHVGHVQQIRQLWEQR